MPGSQSQPVVGWGRFGANSRRVLPTAEE